MFISSLCRLLPVCDIKVDKLNDCVDLFNDKIYTYFRNTYGTVTDEIDRELERECKKLSKSELKKKLKALKHGASETSKIRYVSKLLRSKISIKATESETSDFNSTTDHEKLFRHNLWSYAKKVIERKKRISPTFDIQKCYAFFKDTLKAANPMKVFTVPDWIPMLNDPVKPFSPLP